MEKRLSELLTLDEYRAVCLHTLIDNPRVMDLTIGNLAQLATVLLEAPEPTAFDTIKKMIDYLALANMDNSLRNYGQY